MNEFEYNFVTRVLHKMVLGNSLISKASFEFDGHFVKGRLLPSTDNHIFVSGLARAGTTILLKAFFETNEFVSLTYSDMPFVLAPNLWKKIKPASSASIELKERAHGDRILVNPFSPEAFDEVFWKTFMGNHYIYKDRLVPHTVPPDVIKNFQNYIANIIFSNKKDKTARYLSKNNNNILRLKSLSNAFPNSYFLVLFRNPLQHASSLLNQQKRFIQIQKTNAFTLKYMNWLGHYEFGLGQKPFVFDPLNFDTIIKYSNDSINYWLTIWKDYYQYILDNPFGNVLLIQYEKLCNPETRLIAKINAKLSTSIPETDSYFIKAKEWTDINANASLLQHCDTVYEGLTKRAL